MTINQAAQLMDLLKVFYPRFYEKQTDEEKYTASQLWATMFCDDDINVVLGATKALICADTKGFPPVVGQIKEKIRLLTQPRAMTELEAWALVSKAVGRSNYYAQGEFENLPREIQQVVYSPSVLKEWAMSDMNDFNTVIQSNFCRSYRERVRHSREMQALPGDIKQVFLETGEKAIV